MTELQALLVLGIVTVALALIVALRIHRRSKPIDESRGSTSPIGTGQIPMHELTGHLPFAYAVESADAATVVSLPSANPLFAVFAVGALIGAALFIQSLLRVLTSPSDVGGDLAGLAIGALFVAAFGYVSWPALVHKRLRAGQGLLRTEWSLPIGPTLWTRKDSGVTRLIVRHGRWSAHGSTDQLVVDDGARRYVVETLMNLPRQGSFRWLSNNSPVGEASTSMISSPGAPWSSVSPVMLALAGQLARALGVPAFLEIGRGRPPLITFGDD